MKKIVFFSLMMVTLSLADSSSVQTRDESPVQGNGGTVNYNPTIWNITVATPEEVVRLRQKLAKTPTSNLTPPPKTVIRPKVSPVPVIPTPKPIQPHYVAPVQPTSTANTVYDASTGLRWQDSPDAKTVKKDWAGAKSYCENLTLDGYSDWRLPSYPELLTLVDYTKYNPAIKTGFKNTATDDFYWSASPYVYNGSYAWIVNFSNGHTFNTSKTGKVSVRCVRGRQ